MAPPEELDGMQNAKKSVHVDMPRTSYIKFKIATFERQLSIQDTLAGFVSMIASQDERAYKILDELALMKYNGSLKNFIDGVTMSEVDRELLYEIMEREDAK